MNRFTDVHWNGPFCCNKFIFSFASFTLGFQLGSRIVSGFNWFFFVISWNYRLVNLGCRWILDIDGLKMGIIVVLGMMISKLTATSVWKYHFPNFQKLMTILNDLRGFYSCLWALLAFHLNAFFSVSFAIGFEFFFWW